MTYPGGEFVDTGPGTFPAPATPPPPSAVNEDDLTFAGYTNRGEMVLTDGTNFYIDGEFGLISAGTNNPAVSTGGGGGGTSRPDRNPVDGYWRDNGDGTETWIGVETVYNSDGSVARIQEIPSNTTRPKQDDSGNKVGDQRIDKKTGNVQEWDGTRWVDTGAKDATTKRDTEIIIRNGEQILIDTQTGEEITNLGPVGDDGTPDTKVFPDGSLHQYDKVKKEWVEIAPAPPKDTTAMDIAKLQIEANRASNAARMAFDAKENAAQRAFQAEQAQRDREQQLVIENARGQREHEKTKLEAAKAFAEAVNSVDPTALPAFLAAGGGVIGGGNLSNSESKGANAITDKALLPAARMLNQARSEYKPIEMPGAAPAAGGRGGGGDVEPSRPRGGLFGGWGGGGGFGAGAMDAARTAIGGLFGRRQEETPVVAAANGFDGWVTKPTMFLTGEAGPEKVNVQPAFGGMNGLFGRRGGGFGGRTNQVPYGNDNRTNVVGGTRPTAGGTAPGAPAPSPAPAPPPAANTVPINPLGGDLGITPEDRAAMDEVRRLREGVALPLEQNYGYALDWWNQLPTMQKAQLLALQARTGVSADDWMADYERNRIGGTTRAGLGVRY